MKCKNCREKIQWNGEWGGGIGAYTLINTTTSYCHNTTGSNRKYIDCWGHWHMVDESSIVDDILKSYDL